MDPDTGKDVSLGIKTSIINLVDLAGSERLKKSEAVGQQQKVRRAPPAAAGAAGAGSWASSSRDSSGGAAPARKSVLVRAGVKVRDP